MKSEMSDQIRISRRTALGRACAIFFLLGNTKGPDRIQLQHGETGRVSRIIDGDSFVLDSQGEEISVRLSSIQAPRLANDFDKAWPYAKEAKDALSALISNRHVELLYGKTKRDRYERAIAQVYSLNPDGQKDLWIQAEMLRLGLARVYSWRGDNADIIALYALEEEARQNQRGIWSDDFYAIRSPDPDPLAQYVDSVQIVEGIIISTADVRGRIYLNFGANYKTDFTVAIARKHVRAFDAIDPLSLAGARVRVRGWIELFNGPMIWIDHPDRLEILS